MVVTIDDMKVKNIITEIIEKIKEHLFTP